MMRAAVAKLRRGGGDWRHGAFLLLLGVAAYLFAQLHPAAVQLLWFYTTPLIWVAGVLFVAAAWYLPNRPIGWWPIKLVIIGASVHWAVVLPIRYWWW